MARKRLIAPEFFTHGALYDAEAASNLPLRLAFAGLWTACDRRGLFSWKPRELKLAILPYDPVDFEQVLLALERHGFVVRYAVDGKEFGRIPTFGRWQTFHKHEKPSDVPEPSIGRSEPAIGGADTSKTEGMAEPSTAITVAVAVTGTGTGSSTGAGAVVGRSILKAESVLAQKLLSDHDRNALAALLYAVPNRVAWCAELEAAFQGMHTPPLSAIQLGDAIRDYVAGDHHNNSPSLKHFRAFLLRAVRAPPVNNLAIDDVLTRWANETDAKERAS